MDAHEGLCYRAYEGLGYDAHKGLCYEVCGGLRYSAHKGLCYGREESIL